MSTKTQQGEFEPEMEEWEIVIEDLRDDIAGCAIIKKLKDKLMNKLDLLQNKIIDFIEGFDEPEDQDAEADIKALPSGTPFKSAKQLLEDDCKSCSS